MPVDSTHPAYDAASPKWDRMRDVIAGQDAIHDAGTTYLPRLKDQTSDDYLAYVARATWFSATSRTCDAMHGLLFRKPPTIEAPDAMADILADVTMGGMSMAGFSAQCAREVIEVGRCGVLVDFPSVSELPSNAGQAQSMGLRPFATLYTAEAIINWRTARIANRMQLVLVVLAETHDEPIDEYASDAQAQIRVLRLEDGAYVQEVYRRGKDSGAWSLVQRIEPRVRGARMTFLPFVIFGPEQVSADVSDPPLIDLADLNLSHYRTSADLEHGAHFTGLPMLFVAGVQLDAGAKVSLGSQSALVAPDPAASAQFIEFSGQGLGALSDLLARKEGQMAALGASMLSAPKKQAEAAQTHEMRLGQETASLSDIADTVSQALTTALEWIRDWAGISGEASIALNTDFVVTSMTAQDLTALLTAWQSGAISRETLYWNLQQGEMVPEGKTVEDERSEIEAEGPALAEMTADSNADGQ